MKDSESKIQASYHQWLWNTYPLTRGLCYHIPNGGLRSAVEATRLKAAGVLAGIPDYHHAIAANGFNSLYIEFKEPGANMNTEHVKMQTERQGQLLRAGNAVYVCSSLEEAQNILHHYLKGTAWIVKGVGNNVATLGNSVTH
jgi:hypothetical protein